MYNYFELGKPNGHLLGKDMFIRFTARVFCERLSIFVCMYFFPLVGWMYDFIALNSDCSLYVFFTSSG